MKLLENMTEEELRQLIKDGGNALANGARGGIRGTVLEAIATLEGRGIVSEEAKAFMETWGR